MRCNYCGAELEPGQRFCENCGTGLNGTESPSTGYYQSAPTGAVCFYDHSRDEGLYLAVFILNILSTVCLAFTLIGLAWSIPMTIHSYGMYKGQKPNTVGFGVCTLLFLNLVSGIILLVLDKDR